MKSTLPVLTAQRLNDGTVEVFRAGVLIRTFQSWMPACPGRDNHTVQLDGKYYRIEWRPTK